METNPNEMTSTEGMDELEHQLEEVDAADAPETAEEIARRLGDALDAVDPAEKGTLT